MNSTSEKSTHSICDNAWLSATGPVPIRMTNDYLFRALLDYTLFPKYPEFYATYKFKNVKNHHLYSDKLRISVLDLSRIDLATEEDIKMIAKDNTYIKNAASTIYQLSQEENIQLQCAAREDYYRTQLGLKYEMDRRDSEIETLSAENQRLLAWALEHGYQPE